MGVFAKRTGYTKSFQTVKNHLKYIGFRSKEKEEKGAFFDKDNNKVDYKEFYKRLEENKALKHPNAVKAHKIVFSLREEDYKSYLESGKDYKDLIRATLKEYEEKHNIKLDWIANIHSKDGKGKSNHPHAHVVIKGVSDKNSDGKYQRVKFDKNDFKEFKDMFNKEFTKESEYKEYEYKDFKPYEYTRGEIDRTLTDVAKGIEAVTRNIEYELSKDEAAGEMELQKQAKKKARKNRQIEKENSRER